MNFLRPRYNKSTGVRRVKFWRRCFFLYSLLALPFPAALSAQTARLGNLVWEDANGDGVYQSSEPPIQGAKVNLLNMVGNPVLDVNGNATAQTNAQGEYAFFVKPGTYVLQFVTPRNYTTSMKDQGGNDALDSDYNANNNNRTPPINIGPGGADESIDAAFKPAARFGNLVWDDRNNDGIYQPGEPGIAGATVNLLNSVGNPVLDVNGNSTVQTNSQGVYTFCVKPGTYVLQFVTPMNYITVMKDQSGNHELDSDYDPNNNNRTAPLTLGLGEMNYSIDAAFKALPQATARLGNLVWEDTNGDGIYQSGEPPIPGATVKLLDRKGKSEKDVNGNSKLQTNAQGEYSFEVKPGTYMLKFTAPNGYSTSAKDLGNNDQLDSDYDPANGNETTPIAIAAGQTNMSIDAAFKAPASLGNLVWEDSNGNGVFETGEPPIQSVTVKLLDANGKAMKDLNGNATVQTNANGEYNFFVKPGVYILQFPTPNGYATCAKDQGNNDELDSDYDAANNNKTEPVTITVGQSNNIDGCFYRQARLGNLVWEDMNGNGLFEAGEPPIQGATVKLLDANGNPAQDVNGNSTLQTNAQGEYSFFVKRGAYILQFPTPNGYLPCARDQGADDELDSDYNPNNSNRTARITLAGGQANSAIDAGFKPNFVAATLGNLVWQDLNRDGIFQNDEPRIQDATVNLLDANGNAVKDVNGNATLQTNVNGEYHFYVRPGTYILQFVMPDGYTAVPNDRGNDETRDSDYNSATGRTVPVMIASGQINVNIDAAFYFCPATYIYSLSEEAQQQLTRLRLDRASEQMTVIAEKIIYGGAIPGGQPISGFIAGKALGANTEAMAYDANSRTAYIVSNKQAIAVLLKLDLATGVAHSIGFARTAADSAIKSISALAFNNKTNELYGITANRLLKINPLNAQVIIYPRLITAEAGIHLESASFDQKIARKKLMKLPRRPRPLPYRKIIRTRFPPTPCPAARAPYLNFPCR